MRKLLGLATASAIAAAVLFSGVAPATAAPSAPATPEAAATAAPGEAKSATDTPPATRAPILPATAPSESTPAQTAPAETTPVESTPAEPTPAEAPQPTATPSSHPPFGSVATSPAPGTVATPFAAPLSGVAKPLAAPAANDAFVAKVRNAINGYRAAYGAKPLAVSSKIGAGSQQWATTLNRQINTNTLDWNRVHRPDAGASILPNGFDMYSEIIAVNNNAQQVVDWWMGSPAHRSAMLDKRATDMGLGYVKTTMAGWSGMTMVVANLAGYPDSRNPQPQPNPASGGSAGDIAAVDANGDMYIYPSAKGADMWQRKYVSSGWSGAQQLVVADYNGDGMQDIVAVWKNGNLTVSYGQSNGTFKPLRSIGHGWAPFDIVVTAWKNSDRLPSILAKHRATGDLRYYRNLDGARFGATTRIGTGWGNLTIMGADFDGDGRQDLLARNAVGQLLLYRGTGTGGFMGEARRVVGTGWGSMTHLSGISNHLGTGGQGIMARTSSGSLLHYPIMRNYWGASTQIGSRGWGPLLLGS